MNPPLILAPAKRSFAPIYRPRLASRAKIGYAEKRGREGRSMEEQKSKRGYLNEDFRLFHVRDQVELELSYHYHEFNKIVVFLAGNVTYVVEGKGYFLDVYKRQRATLLSMDDGWAKIQYNGSVYYTWGSNLAYAY